MTVDDNFITKVDKITCIFIVDIVKELVEHWIVPDRHVVGKIEKVSIDEADSRQECFPVAEPMGLLSSICITPNNAEAYDFDTFESTAPQTQMNLDI